MSAETEKKTEGGKSGLFSDLSDREKKYLLGLACIMPLLAIALGIGLIQQSVADIEMERHRYKQALDLLAAAGPAYAKQKGAGGTASTHKNVDDDVIRDNDIKLTSFVAEHAQATNITVTSYDEDELPFGSTDKNAEGPILVEKQLRVEIRKAQMDDLVKLLDRIEKSTEPVWVKRLDIRKHRRDPGQIRAIITVSTFTRKQKST